MDKKYLDKVIDQLLSETKIMDFDKGYERGIYRRTFSNRGFFNRQTYVIFSILEIF